MRKLGLDLGGKTCGFAISDSLMIIANGIENLHYPENNFEPIIKKIEYYLEYYWKEIDTIVLGYPTNIDGTKNASTLLIESFYSLLVKSFPQLIIVYHDERYTTKIATEYLFNANVKASKRKKVIDKVAATVILQDYLNTLQKNK